MDPRFSTFFPQRRSDRPLKGACVVPKYSQEPFPEYVQPEEFWNPARSFSKDPSPNKERIVDAGNRTTPYLVVTLKR